jgi:crossover junction endodeoxyribonuclease RuvC
VKILGIDPGFGILGWAVIEHTLSVKACGTIQTDKDFPIDERLLQIHLSLRDILAKYSPDCAAIERLFFSRNTTTALDVSKAIGVIILTLKLSGINYTEYSPLTVKQAITGYSKASKDQVRDMIIKLLKCDDELGSDDVYDALAIAACHSFSISSPARKSKTV